VRFATNVLAIPRVTVLVTPPNGNPVSRQEPTGADARLGWPPGPLSAARLRYTITPLSPNKPATTAPPLARTRVLAISVKMGPSGTDDDKTAQVVPRPGQAALASRPPAPWPARQDELDADGLASRSDGSRPCDGITLTPRSGLTSEPKARTGCGNTARPDPWGGRRDPEMLSAVPTAILGPSEL
jgi:hypothetical protein